jgi:hypothetical protein
LRYSWSYLIPDKSGLKHIILIFFRLLEVTYNIHVEKICLDNSGENINMADAIKADGYNVTFEFVSPGSLQYNGVVERIFATLFGMVQSMLDEACVPMNLCCGLWAQVAMPLICVLILSHTRVKHLLMRSLWVLNMIT